MSSLAPTGATFVLVHGAWHGGWSWKRLVPFLRGLGHDVYAPTLTGVGDRAHLLTPDIGLDTHIQDVAAVLEYEDLQDVVLVGHSYAGTVITAVAETAGSRLKHLVYLDAGVPEPGESLLDRAVDFLKAHIETARSSGEGWRVPSLDVSVFGIDDPSDAAWVRSRLRDMPYRSFAQGVDFPQRAAERLPRTYIQTTEALNLSAGRAKAKGFRYISMLSAGHDVMVTRPRELSLVLHEVVRGK